MLKLAVDGNWLFCAAIAASQLVGGCFRLHHEDTVGAAVQMLSGVGCLFALRRFRVSFVRRLLIPAVLLSLFYEFSQIHNAIRYGSNVRSFRRVFWNCATLWSCVASFWFIQLWKVLIDAEVARAKKIHEKEKEEAKLSRQPEVAASPAEAKDESSKAADDTHATTTIETDNSAANGSAVDFLSSVPEGSDADFFVNSEAEENQEPLLLSFT